VPVGPHDLPSAPVLSDARLPQTVQDAVRRMAELVDALPPRPVAGRPSEVRLVELTLPSRPGPPPPGQQLHFACASVVPGCVVIFRGTKEQILGKVSAHAAADHGMAVVPDDVVAQVLASMVPVS
jgi:predicted small metal-binding protein